MSLQPYAIPKDGFAGTGGANSFQEPNSVEGHNNAVAAFPTGTKVRYNNDTLGGYGSCVYLKFDNGAGNVAIVAGSLLKSTVTIGTVTGDVTDQAAGGGTCIALSAITDGNYGWFWCAGVCPDLNTAASTKFSASSILTDGNVVADVALIGTAADLTIGIATTGQLTPHLGYALATDSSTALAMASVVLYDNFG